MLINYYFCSRVSEIQCDYSKKVDIMFERLRGENQLSPNSYVVFRGTCLLDREKYSNVLVKIWAKKMASLCQKIRICVKRVSRFFGVQNRSETIV